MTNYFRNPAVNNALVLEYAAQAAARRQAEEIKHQAEMAATAAFIELNNLYLAIERKPALLTIHTANQLRLLAGQAYEQNDPMLDYWLKEFQKLSRWDKV